MPVNPGIEYGLAKEQYDKARTTEEKIKALQKMISSAPKHKGTENLLKQLKQKLSKLKQASIKAAKKASYQISIKKEGAAQIVLVGMTNTGKSLLLSKLTNAKPEIAEYLYTTKLPEQGILDYNGIKLQLIEIPAITENFVYTSKGPFLFGLVKQSDLVLLILDSLNYEEQLNFLHNELEKGNVNNKFLYVVNRCDLNDIGNEKYLCVSALTNLNLELLKQRIWENLDVIAVYTKMPGKKKDFPPLALKKGSSVRDLAEHIHKDFVSKFRFARIWGKSVKFDSQTVGLDHILTNNDVVEFHTI